MKEKLLIALLVLFYANSFAQTFEGTITYRMQLFNPNPELIPQTTWDTQMKATLGEEGYMLQKYFYKDENYISEIIAGKEEGHYAIYFGIRSFI